MATATIEDESTHCCSCERVGDDTAANRWCQECSEGLCDNCSKYHRSNKLSSKHHVVPLCEMSDVAKLLSKLRIDLHCVSHPEGLIVAYCQTDDVFCCSVCIVACHKQCGDVIPIEKTVAMYTEQLQADDTERYKEIHNHITSMIIAEDHVMSEAGRSVDAALQKGANDIKALKQMLDNLYASSKTELRQKQEQVTQSAFNRQSLLREFEVKIQNAKKGLELLSKISPTQRSVVRKQLAAKTREDFTKLIKSFTAESLRLHYTKRTDIFATFKTLSTLCDVSIRTHNKPIAVAVEQIVTDLEKPIPPPISAQVAVSVHKKDLMHADLRHVKTLTKVELGAEFITGITFLSNNNLMFCDINKHNLVELNINYNVTNRFGGGRRGPMFTGMCVTSDEICVYANAINEVLKYQLFGQYEISRFDISSASRHCKTGYGSWGVVCTVDKIITGYPDQVVVYDKQGRQLHSVSRQGTITYPAVSTDGTKLYHADGNQLVCRKLDRLTHEVFRYTSPDLKEPCGICLDGEENVYIAGSESGNIHQVSRDGTKGRILIPELKLIKKPFVICFNKNNNTLAVSSHAEDTSIEIYRFDNSEH